VGPSGEIYVAGSTGSPDLPGANGLQQSHGGGFDDAYVVKVRADGTSLEYATYLGGGANDSAGRIAVNTAGEAYVVGQTSSPNFPVAAAFQPTFGGGFNDAFVTKLTADGSSLVFSTYLGGVDRDLAVGLALGADGTVQVGGSTASFNFPRINALQPFLAGGFADAFVAKIEPDGQGLIFSTFLGGQGADVGVSVAVGADGNLYLAGETDSFDFPVIAPIQGQVNGSDGFVMQLSADGQTLVQSTPLGGTGLDVAVGLAFSLTDEVWIVGRTDSTDFPLVNAFQPFHAGSMDAFVVRLGTPPSNQPPTASAGPDVEVTASGCTAQVLLDGTGSSDPDGDPLTFQWSGDFGTVTGATPTVELPPGTYTVTLSVADGRGGTASDTVIVTVHPDAPPEIAGATATPNVLTPADHRMVPVTVSVDLTGGCASETTCRIVSVLSSEPSSGLGHGDLAPDWTITGPLTLLMRAEHGPRSLGRVYLVVVECQHTSGVRSRTATLVVVPR
jgi:PKD domain